MKPSITDKMIEAGGKALAEWSAPNLGAAWWGRNKEFDDAKREQVRIVLEAALTLSDDAT